MEKFRGSGLQVVTVGKGKERGVADEEIGE